MCNEHNTSNNSRQLVNPREFRTDVLPMEMRQVEVEKLKKYNVNNDVNSARLKRTLEDARLNLLKPQADIEQIKKFVRRTVETDKYRNMHLYDYHKELGDWVYSTYDEYFS